MQVISLKEMYKRLQEYNTSLQQYNSKLQTDLSAANESLTRVEKEKLAIVENLSSLRGHYNSLQDQLTSTRVSQFLDFAIETSAFCPASIALIKPKIGVITKIHQHFPRGTLLVLLT